MCMCIQRSKNLPYSCICSQWEWWLFPRNFLNPPKACSVCSSWYLRPENSASLATDVRTIQQRASSHVQLSEEEACMTRKSLQSLIIRQMDTVLLASGERLFRSRLCIPSSGHLLSSLSDEMALQQNPRLVHFGFPTASQRCNKEEKTFCSEAARGPNEMWHINFWAMKLYNPSGFGFRIQGSQGGWDSLFCEKSVYFTHCLWLGFASYNHLWEQPLTWKTRAHELLCAFVQRRPRSVNLVAPWNRTKSWSR